MSTSTPAAPPHRSEGGDLRSRLAELPGLLERLTQDLGVPGVSVGVLDRTETDVFVAGVAQLGTQEPVEADTAFQIGSNAKLWTATVVVQLAEEGRLDLDAPVTAYVPEFRLDHADASKVTSRHLLTHTAGFLGDFFGDDGTDSLESFVRQLVSVEQLHPVGEMWSYCNSGWVLLGRLIEHVTGLDYGRAMRVTLLDRIGDTRTRMGPEDDPPQPRAQGHVPNPVTGALEVGPDRLLPACAPAGSVPVSTAQDVLRFVRLHLDGGRAQDGTRVLSPAGVRQMQRQHVAVPASLAPTHGLGLGWMLRSLADGQRVIGHGGGTPSGFVSMLEVVPDRQVAVVVLTNALTGGELAAEVVEHVLTEVAGAGLADKGFAWPEPPLTLDLPRYAGRYGAGGTAFDVVAPGDGTLRVGHARQADAPGPSSGADWLSLVALGETCFASPRPGSSTVMEFLDLDRDGRPRYLFAGRLYPRIS